MILNVLNVLSNNCYEHWIIQLNFYLMIIQKNKKSFNFPFETYFPITMNCTKHVPIDFYICTYQVQRNHKYIVILNIV